MRNYKKDFPILNKNINGRKLTYLDSAATSQKPQQVIDALIDYYENYNANVRRGIYPIAEKATEKVEEVRKKVAKFINAKDPSEIIFVRNTTEGLNLVAQSFASHNIKRGAQIVTTIIEHHSNFVPWQQLAKMKKFQLEVLDFDENFQFPISNFQSISKKARLLAITHVSNVLGTINPLEKIIKEIRRKNPGIVIVVDAAQSVPHLPVDVQKLDCDFLAFSGHKMLAATGIGVLYGRKKILENMEPFLLGGDMIREVYVDRTVFDIPPGRFEAGTPDIAGIISLGVAIDYLNSIGMNNVEKYERKLIVYALQQLKKIKGLDIYGPKESSQRSGVIAFNINKIHAHDVAQILGDMGVCVRVGHHCAMPLHQKLGIPASVRASFYVYNTKEDVDQLIEGIKKVKEIFKVS